VVCGRDGGYLVEIGDLPLLYSTPFPQTSSLLSYLEKGEWERIREEIKRCIVNLELQDRETSLVAILRSLLVLQWSKYWDL